MRETSWIRKPIRNSPVRRVDSPDGAGLRAAGAAAVLFAFAGVRLLLGEADLAMAGSASLKEIALRTAGW